MPFDISLYPLQGSFDEFFIARGAFEVIGTDWSDKCMAARKKKRSAHRMTRAEQHARFVETAKNAAGRHITGRLG
jgi:hypothetical protein